MKIDLTAITTTASGIFGAIIAADHCLANSKNFIQNSAGPFLWAIITRQPVKVQAQTKGEDIMAVSLANIEAMVVKAEALAKRGLAALDNLAQLAEKIEPLIEQFDPAAGKELETGIKAVEDLTGTDLQPPGPSVAAQS